MKKEKARLLIIVCVFLSILGLVLSLSSTPARAEIKELKIGIGIDADTLNPQEATSTLIINICDLIYGNIFELSPDMDLLPGLVTKHEVSEEGKVITFHLRKSVKFSDGTPFDAKALKINLDRALNPKVRMPLRFVISMIKEVIVVDNFMVQLRLDKPFAPLIQNFTIAITSPMSPAALKKYGDDIRQNPVGAGPYKLKEWVKGTRIVLERNENYYGRKPTVEKLTFLVVPDALTRESMLRAGQIDICYKPLPASIASLKADPNIRLEMPLSTRTVFMGLNYSKGVTKNKLVRQAFNYAVNKKAIIAKTLFGAAAPMDSTLSPIMNGYTKMDYQYAYNPNKAKELLEKANFDFSQTINMRTPQGRYLFDKEVAEVVQSYLQAIGVKTELRVYDWPTYIAGLMKPLEETELEVFLFAWGPPVPETDLSLYGMFHSKTNPPKGMGGAHYRNSEVDKLLDQTRIVQDMKERQKLFKQASEIIWEDCPWLWLYVEKFVMAYNSKLKGMVVNGLEKFYPTYVTMD